MAQKRVDFWIFMVLLLVFIGIYQDYQDKNPSKKMGIYLGKVGIELGKNCDFAGNLGIYQDFSIQKMGVM